MRTFSAKIRALENLRIRKVGKRVCIFRTDVLNDMTRRKSLTNMLLTSLYQRFRFCQVCVMNLRFQDLNGVL